MEREEIFKIKFNTAAHILGVKPAEVVSLKLRETASSSNDYHRLRETLEKDAELKPSEIEGNLQGTGYLLWHGKSKIIIVAHTTGLEILYIAGSISSLVSLIPIVLQCWASIRSYLDFSYQHDFRSLEIRRLDTEGCLVQHRIETTANVLYTPLSIINKAICDAAEIIDERIESLGDEIRGIRARVAALEQKAFKNNRL
jgi:hypothetical protein